jgi:hypothetical protein
VGSARKTSKNGSSDKVIVQYDGWDKNEKNAFDQNDLEVVSRHKCYVHVLFSQDLVGKQWDNFMLGLKLEHDRLLKNESTSVSKEFQPYLKIEKKKYSRHRSVDYNIDAIEKHRDRYTGHICFITNDKTISTAEQSLKEYSTRDYIEKDFDEMKNDLDMKRIRVHTDARMCARLLIQFIAEIILREIRVNLKNSNDCKKMTRKQISSHIKGIYKVVFKGKYKDVKPTLSKSQRCILEALGIKDTR